MLEGDVDKALAGAEKVLEMEYTTDMVCHATMEPLNATVQFVDGAWHVYSGTQSTSFARMTLTAYLSKVLRSEARGHQDLRARVPARRRLRRQAGLRRDPGGGVLRQGSRTPGQADPDPRIDVRHQFRAHADLPPAEGRAEGRPTCRHEPRHLLRLDGRRASPSARSSGTDWLQLDSWHAKKKDIDQWSIGGSDHWYDVENHRVRAFDSDRTTWAVQASALRTVSNSYNMFVVESFMDEVAHALKRDPLEFRLALLNGKGGNRGIPNTGYAPGTPSDYYMDRLWISLPWPKDNRWPPYEFATVGGALRLAHCLRVAAEKSRLGREEAAAQYRHGHRRVLGRGAAEPDLGRRHRRGHRGSEHRRLQDQSAHHRDGSGHWW